MNIQKIRDTLRFLAKLRKVRNDRSIKGKTLFATVINNFGICHADEGGILGI